MPGRRYWGIFGPRAELMLLEVVVYFYNSADINKFPRLYAKIYESCDVIVIDKIV
jgi:hypothetical protein